jgi:hypothetical protein
MFVLSHPECGVVCLVYLELKEYHNFYMKGLSDACKNPDVEGQKLLFWGDYSLEKV